MYNRKEKVVMVLVSDKSLCRHQHKIVAKQFTSGCGLALPNTFMDS